MRMMSMSVIAMRKDMNAIVTTMMKTSTNATVKKKDTSVTVTTTITTMAKAKWKSMV
jgi:hypothetical protein